MYSDDFLAALGAWQNGWREDKSRRVPITRALVAAATPIRAELPISHPLPLCYRKRFLVPNNPQNGGDFVALIWDGRIDERVAAWTTDPALHHKFKELLRSGNVTALFAHEPRPDEVLVDLNALWADSDFAQAVESYVRRSGDYADALDHFKDEQRELILNAPLLSEEVIGFVGVVGDDTVLFEALGAQTDDEQDEVYRRLVAINVLPGDSIWIGAASAQRAIRKTRAKWEDKLNAFNFRRRLIETSSMVSPKQLRAHRSP